MIAYKDLERTGQVLLIAGSVTVFLVGSAASLRAWRTIREAGG